MILAHGWCMGVAFAVLFPVGAMLLHLLGGRTRHVAWIHGIWQLFSLMLGIAGAGLGGWLVANESRDVSRLTFCPTFPKTTTSDKHSSSAATAIP